MDNIPMWAIYVGIFLITLMIGVITYFLQRRDNQIDSLQASANNSDAKFQQDRKELFDDFSSKMDRILEQTNSINSRLVAIETKTLGVHALVESNKSVIADLQKWQGKQESNIATLLEWKRSVQNKI